MLQIDLGNVVAELRGDLFTTGRDTRGGMGCPDHFTASAAFVSLKSM